MGVNRSNGGRKHGEGDNGNKDLSNSLMTAVDQINAEGGGVTKIHVEARALG